jgi:hypothetical protein
MPRFGVSAGATSARPRPNRNSSALCQSNQRSRPNPSRRCLLHRVALALLTCGWQHKREGWRCHDAPDIVRTDHHRTVVEKPRRRVGARVTLPTYADRNLVDLRTWFAADGKLKLGKGFAADVGHLPRLVAALARATELGLLTDNDNRAEAAQ